MVFGETEMYRAKRRMYEDINKEKREQIEEFRENRRDKPLYCNSRMKTISNRKVRRSNGTYNGGTYKKAYNFKWGTEWKTT